MRPRRSIILDRTLPLSAAAVLALASCTTFSGHVRTVRDLRCPDALREHQAIAAHPAYRRLPADERDSYEIAIARCFVEAGRIDAAEELAKRWAPTSRQATLELAIVAAAHRNDAAAVRSGVAELAKLPGASPRFFTDCSQLASYAGEEWLVEAALATWSEERGGDLEAYVAKLLGTTREALLPLAVAHADRDRPAGDWVVWTGRVRSGSIDRQREVTTIELEGVVVERKLVVIDRRVESLVTRPKPSAGLFPSGAVESVPTYATNRTYEEIASPTARPFMARLPGIDEAPIAKALVVVVGRYEGRTEDGSAPIVRPLAIVERRLAQTVEPSW